MSQNRVTKNNPMLVMLLIDRSGSMAEKLTYNGELMSKSQAVSLIINNFIEELLHRCRRGFDYHMNYFEIAIIGYHQDEIYNLLDYSASPKTILSVSDLINLDTEKQATAKRRIGANGSYVTFITETKRWVESNCGGNTPMYSALYYACEQIDSWIQTNNHKSLVPPILIHITDGDATDSDEHMLIEISDKIKKLSTNGNNTLFMNVNISTVHSNSVVFPKSLEEIPSNNKYAKLLYEMSSYLPEEFMDGVQQMKKNDAHTSVKAMAYNASINELIGMLSIGTSTIY